MADEELIRMLLQGTEVWELWRKEHSERDELDLRGARLRGANLRGVQLRGADLKGADLRGADLTEADLYGTKLYEADFTEANLNFARIRDSKIYRTFFTKARLSNADFTNARMVLVEFPDADLTQAHLISADLVNVDFSRANLTQVEMGRTLLNSVNLSGAVGLENVFHHFPSDISISTLYKSEGKIPDVFLRGCGVPESFIVQIPALVAAMQPIQFYSCFISYSSKDEELAKRLHADLQSNGVRCWFAPEDLKIGERFRRRIDEVIRVYDRLLLILSENSVTSSWVEKEVETAMESEDEQKRTVLFPVRLDDSVLETKVGWPADVRRTRHIGDFRRWKDHDEYQKAFNRLLADLKAEA